MVTHKIGNFYSLYMEYSNTSLILCKFVSTLESLLPILEMVKEFSILLKFVRIIQKLNENMYVHFTK